MRRRCALLCLTALAPFAVAGAQAGDQPTTMPTRDVDVLYRLAGAADGKPAEQRVRWQAATGRQRIDPPTPGLHIIVDPRAHRLASIRDAERLALEIDQSEIKPLGGSVTHYARRGEDSVGGIACTVWQAGPEQGAPLLCFTDDGVLLRVASAGRVVIEAVRVTYAPSDPADFEVPAGYQHIVRPSPQPAPAPAAAPQEIAK